MRVASLIPSATEIVASLGFGSTLVARSHSCDYPAWVGALPALTSPKLNVEAPSAEIDTQVQRLVRDGLSVYRVDEEQLRELAPDLIVTQDQCEVCAASLADVEAAVSCWLDRRPELVERAGAENLFGEAGRHSAYLDWSALLRADPDVVVLMPCGFDQDRTRTERSALETHAEWWELRAVREGRVFCTDGHQYFNRPGPRLVTSLQILAEILHPEVFPPVLRGRAWSLLGASGDRPNAEIRP